jgi:hypothetical protein
MSERRAPLPFLTAEEVKDRLRILGFHFQGPDQELIPNDTLDQQKKFTALRELLAGTIAEWADLSLDNIDGGTWADLEAELQEWTEGFLGASDV